jgi:hypothetical protein
VTSNINLDHKPDINHFNIEKIDRLHATAIARIQSVMGSGSFWLGWEVQQPSQPNTGVALIKYKINTSELTGPMCLAPDLYF